MSTNINFDKKLGLKGGTGITLPTSFAPSFENTKSILLGGIDDGVEYGSVYNMADDGSNAFSISCWFKTTSSDTQVIVSKQRAISPFNGYGVSLSGGEVRFVIGSNPNWLIVDTINTFNDGNWHNAVVTYDGSRNANGVNIYVDGSAVSTTSVVNNAPLSVINTTNFMISGRNGGANFQFGFNGNIDEVGIWSTTELTSTQANEIGGTIPTDLSTYNPTSWWRCGDGDTSPTLTDNGSGGNDGTMQGFSTFSPDVPPNSFTNTKSIELGGIDDCVDIGVPSDLRFNRLDTFSFSAWVNVSPTDSNTILSNQLAPSTNYRGYYFSVQSNQLICIFRSTLSDRLIFNGSTNLSSGWNHVVFTYDGTASTNSGQFYINGSADTTTGTGTLTATAESTDTLYLGCRSNADNFLLGNIDEVSVFNSELSASDVTSIYNSGVPNDISSLSPLSWWRCGDGDTAPILTDNGSVGNDGTMESFSTFSTDVPT